MTDAVTTVDLLRHGEPAGGPRFRGTTDDPLSELGWQQMRATVGTQLPWEVVVSSPLRRCAAFAEWLAGTLPPLKKGGGGGFKGGSGNGSVSWDDSEIPPDPPFPKGGMGSLEVEPRFAEIAFGEWEGRTAQELLEASPDALAAFWRDPVIHTPPGGEPFDAFAMRVVAAWDALLAHHEGQSVVLVTHAGVIRLILAHVLGMPLANLFRVEVPFAGLSRIRVEGRGADALPQLIFHGRTRP
jgi:alpha-ribazole phosphatase/probable phosphoglycerate mutase